MANFDLPETYYLLKIGLKLVQTLSLTYLQFRGSRDVLQFCAKFGNKNGGSDLLFLADSRAHFYASVAGLLDLGLHQSLSHAGEDENMDYKIHYYSMVQ